MGRYSGWISHFVFVVYLCVINNFEIANADPRQSPSINTNIQGRRTFTEPAFANAGTTPGLQIWKIIDFKPISVASSDFGKFYTGDSYIVLSTKENRGRFNWDIHFWLGKETTQDESGTAAILTVMLDDQLNGVPTQYRELQEHESQLFRSYFKSGLQYLPGGVNSGFRHVTPNTLNQKRLYQVKGKRDVRIREVDLSAASLNAGDCFILDIENSIYVYQGPKSKRVERLKAVSAANLIRDQDHGGRPRIYIIDETSTESDAASFFSNLGRGSVTQIPDESAGGDDEAFERSEERGVTFYKVSNSNGKMNVSPIRQVQQTLLDTNDCFILNTVEASVYVWVGKKCNAAERSEAMNKAQVMLNLKKLPSWAKVEKIIEGGEPSIFRQYFRTWQGTRDIHSRLIRTIKGNSVSAEFNDYLPDNLEKVEEPILLTIDRNSNGDLMMRQVVDYRRDDLVNDKIFMLDTGNEIFIWVGKNCSSQQTEETIRELQDFLGEERKKSPITIIKEGEETDFFKSFFPSWSPFSLYEFN